MRIRKPILARRSIAGSAGIAGGEWAVLPDGDQAGQMGGPGCKKDILTCGKSDFSPVMSTTPLFPGVKRKLSVSHYP